MPTSLTTETFSDLTILEQHDELGLPWDEWADGRVRRLVKGRDFLQSADALKEAAENAAQRLDKVAVTVKEIRYGNVFVWFQFVEYQIELGDPCPCGSYDLQRVNLQFAECGSCKATLLVLEPKKRKEPPDEGAADDDPLLDSLLHGPARRQGEDPARQDTKSKERSDQTRPVQGDQIIQARPRRRGRAVLRERSRPRRTSLVDGRRFSAP